MMNRISILLVVAAVLTIAGCTPPQPKNTIDAAALHKMDKSAPIAVMPLHFYAARDPGFIPVYKRVDQQIVTYLQDNGYTVVDPVILTEAWKRAKTQVGGIADGSGAIQPEQLTACLTQTIENLKVYKIEPALVVDPIIEFKPVEMRGSGLDYGHWDGVERKAVAVEDKHWIRPMWKHLLAMSIAITIHSAQVETVFEGIGGIDFITRGEIDGDEFRMVNRDVDDYSDAVIAEGIRIAFHPFINHKRTE